MSGRQKVRDLCVCACAAPLFVPPLFGVLRSFTVMWPPLIVTVKMPAPSWGAMAAL